MPPRRPGSLASGGRRKKSSASTSVVARIQEQQQKRLEHEQQLQHQRSLAQALTAREVDADDDSDYGIELDDSVSTGEGERCFFCRQNSIVVRYCFFSPSNRASSVVCPVFFAVLTRAFTFVLSANA